MKNSKREFGITESKRNSTIRNTILSIFVFGALGLLIVSRSANMTLTIYFVIIFGLIIFQGMRYLLKIVNARFENNTYYFNFPFLEKIVAYDNLYGSETIIEWLHGDKDLPITTNIKKPRLFLVIPLSISIVLLVSVITLIAQREFSSTNILFIVILSLITIGGLLYCAKIFMQTKKIIIDSETVRCIEQYLWISHNWNEPIDNYCVLKETNSYFFSNQQLRINFVVKLKHTKDINKDVILWKARPFTTSYLSRVSEKYPSEGLSTQAKNFAELLNLPLKEEINHLRSKKTFN